MPTAVKKTISLPPDLARAAEKMAKTEGKTLSAIVQDALRKARAANLREELGDSQDYWSSQAKERGILTEEDLERYLEA
jgi:NTP pyrophosphatase (non-canonical NTP hydrolase)